MLSVHARIGTNRGNKQADAAEVQRARSCASSGCFINVQVNSGNKFFFFSFPFFPFPLSTSYFTLSLRVLSKMNLQQIDQLIKLMQTN